MKAARLLGFCCGIALPILSLLGASKPILPPPEHELVQREARDRVVLAWSGPIAAPMRDQFVAALDRLKGDPRRIVLALNSPGGSVEHGREVMAAIRDAARGREIDTLVENGAACASMCVAIYLLGSERIADPGAHFMFHEASLDAAAGKAGAAMDAPLRRNVEQAVTDLLFAADFRGPRVNPQWLAGVRLRIPGRDIWMSGQQLMDEGSGVVDTLAPPSPA